jgi:hypothetical protein
MGKLGTTLAAVALGFAAAGPAAAVTGPALAVASPTIDVGTVHRGEKIEARFALRNDGAATLSIREARPACGCTVATFDREIAPGGAGEVHATVDTSRFSGPITKTVSVVTNDPSHPETTLTIKAVVAP